MNASGVRHVKTAPPRRRGAASGKRPEQRAVVAGREPTLDLCGRERRPAAHRSGGRASRKRSSII